MLVVLGVLLANRVIQTNGLLVPLDDMAEEMRAAGLIPA